MTTTFATAFGNLITKIEGNFTWLKNQVTSLVTSVGTKASSTDLTTHTGNTTVHITSSERDTWNGKQNALTATQLNNIANVPNKADISSVPTKVSDLTNDADYATKSYVDTKVTSAVRHCGSITFANLPALTSANVNKCYNVTDAFTTTSDFLEGAGAKYPAGTNVMIVEAGTNTYKYDAKAGFYDLSIYYEIDDLDTDLSSMFTTGAGNITDLTDNSNSNS